MYAGPINDTHRHFWDLANDYDWLSRRAPEFERLIGNGERLRRNVLVPPPRSR
jgi:predicted TIM-barrel fold metal-dependent hydrolase